MQPCRTCEKIAQRQEVMRIHKDAYQKRGLKEILSVRLDQSTCVIEDIKTVRGSITGRKMPLNFCPECGKLIRKRGLD